MAGDPDAEGRRVGWVVAAIVLAAYALPERTAEAWAAKSAGLAAALVLLAGWRMTHGGSPAGIRAAAPWLALGGWSAIGASWSGDPVRTVFQAIVLGALAVLASTKLRMSIRILFVALLVPALLEAVVAFTGAGVSGNAMLRASGTFVNADHFAACLAIGMALVLALVVAAGRRGVLLRTALLALLAAAAGASASRALVAAIIVVAAGAWWLAPQGFTRPRWLIGAAAAAIGLAAAPALAARLADQVAGREAFAWGRFDLWQVAARAVRTSPLGGAGLGTFGEAFAAARPERFAAFGSEYAHSEPLQVAVETGVIGLGFLLWGLAVVLRQATGWRGSDPELAGLRLAAVAVAVFSLVDFPFHAPAIAIPAVMALLASRATARSHAIAADPVPRWAMLSVWGVAGGLMLWLLSVGAADWCYAGGVRLALGSDVGGARDRFTAALAASPEHAGALQGVAELDPASPQAPAAAERAARLRPGWPDAARTQFDFALRRQDLAAAAGALARMERLDPFGLETRLLKVRWNESTGDLGAAIRELAAAEALWPANLDIWYAKADLAERQGRRAAARRLLRHILRIYPSAEYAHAWLGRLAP